MGSKKNLAIALALITIVGLFGFWALYLRNTEIYTSFFTSEAGGPGTADGFSVRHTERVNGQGNEARVGIEITNTSNSPKTITIEKQVYWCANIPPNNVPRGTCSEHGSLTRSTVTIAAGASVQSGVLRQLVGNTGTCGSAQVDIWFGTSSPTQFGPYWGLAWLQPCTSTPTPSNAPVSTNPPPDIGIQVQKTSNATASCVAPGTAVRYTYRVTNTSSRGQLKNITISDPKCANITGPTGDTGNDQTLPLNETWQYTCTTNLAQTTTNTVTVRGAFNGDASRMATDTDTLTVPVCGATSTPTTTPTATPGPTSTPTPTPTFTVPPTATPTFTPSPFLSLSIEKLGENISQQNPQLRNRVDAVPGDLLRFTLRVTSDANTRLTNVVVRDVLPTELIYEPGSTRVNNAVYPDGIIGNGILIASLDPGQRLDVTFRARVKPTEVFPTGTTVLVNAGYARADGVGERESKIPIYITKNILVPLGEVQAGVDGTTLTLISSLLLTFGYHFGRSGVGMIKGTLQSHHLIPSSRMLTVMATLLLLLGGSLSVSSILRDSQVTAIEIRNPVVHTDNDSYFGFIGR